MESGKGENDPYRAPSADLTADSALESQPDSLETVRAELIAQLPWLHVAIASAGAGLLLGLASVAVVGFFMAALGQASGLGGIANYVIALGCCLTFAAFFAYPMYCIHRLSAAIARLRERRDPRDVLFAFSLQRAAWRSIAIWGWLSLVGVMGGVGGLFALVVMLAPDI
ncbi:MAG: hypothetical protein NTV21_18970 [Planctomycetota bacterium]|nr:hypothetical protein [Planctomycetota bacterium]